MNILFVIPIIFSLYCRVLSEKCSLHNFESYYVTDYVCIELDAAPGSNMSSAPTAPRADVSMTVKNAAMGTLEVRFPIPSGSDFSSYDVDMFVNETKMTESECRSLHPDYNFLRHSMQYFDVFKCSDLEAGQECVPSCTKMASMTFPYVFSGCYYARVTPMQLGGGTGKFTDSLPVFITTEYKKKGVWEMEMIVNNQCYPGPDSSQTVTVNVINELVGDHPVLVKLLGRVRGASESDACVHAGFEHTCCTFSAAHNNSANCLRKKDSDKNPDKCYLIPGQSDGQDTLECVFSGVQPGNYCILIEVHDSIRCEGLNEAWTTDNDGKFRICRFIFPNITCNETPAPLLIKHPIPTDNSGIYLAVGAVLACSVVFGAVIVYYIHRRLQSRPEPLAMDPVQNYVQTSRPRVLLLYAQDCREFMNLMTTFRILLRNVGECEVLDCFDPDYTEEIARSPVEWMRSRASSEDVKVVVVASDCAVAHQKAMTRGIAIQYREPLPNSHLFLYGLKEVTYNHKRGEYTNTFVVRLDEKDLDYLTPYTRYVLPLHLQELLKSLNSSLDVSTISEYKDEQMFRDDHSDMMHFKRQNPDYFTELITRSEEIV